MTPDGLEQAWEAFGKALDDGDIDALVACYEPDGIFVSEPGTGAAGIKPLRQGLTEFWLEGLNGKLATKPTVTSEKSELLLADGIALSVDRWTITGTEPDGEPVEIHGTATDVFRRQPDGSWRVAIDNPWGPAVLG